ncbi:MAG: hypothetical protein QE487_12040 [Fluviicola sp.]|nr:hypothetical protein [Fluviicola sp.]
MGFLSTLFKGNRPDNLSKVDYWKKWEFFELLDDLHAAEKQLSEYKGGYSEEFLSAEEFHEALIDAIDDIEFGNQTDLTRFWLWFAPTCAWDDFVGQEGEELGNKIFERVDRWKKGHS